MSMKWSTTPCALHNASRQRFHGQQLTSATQVNTTRRSASRLRQIARILLPGQDSASGLTGNCFGISHATGSPWMLLLTRCNSRPDAKRDFSLQFPDINRKSEVASSGEHSFRQLQPGSGATCRSKRKVRDIGQLRAILGLEDGLDPLPATLVAVDVETEPKGIPLTSCVVEVGITVLNTRDIKGIEPGEHVMNWMSKASHHHFVIDFTAFLQKRTTSSLFCKSQVLSALTTKEEIKQLWKTLEPNTILVGHGLSKDIASLSRDSGWDLNLLTLRPNTKIYDTLDLANGAKCYGVKFRSKSLQGVVRRLDPHPQYLRNEKLVGWHNAGNDAAYSMMAALMIAVRCKSLLPEDQSKNYPNPFRQTVHKLGRFIGMFLAGQRDPLSKI